MVDPVVTAQGVELRRGGSVIVPSLDLQIEQGTLFGLVGPSGSGKTTIMRAMLGLGAISNGEISILGLPAGHPDLRMQLGYQPQQGGAWPDLTARECLQFMQRIYRVTSSRIDAVLNLMELQPFAGRPVATLSGGQERRVSLAMAILHHPALLILDEPTVGLDPRLRHRLWQEFRRWIDTGTTIILSTHVMTEAALCDTIAVVMSGEVIDISAPEALRTRYQTNDLEDAMLSLFEEATPYVH